MLRWFTFLPADGHSASLKLNQRDETLSFPSYFLLNRATGDPRVASNAPLEPHARQATVLFRHASFAIGRSVTTERANHESGVYVHACQITCRRRRMPRGTSGTRSQCCMRSQITQLVDLRVDEWLANCKTAWASIVDSSEVQERPSVCRSRKKKDFANVEKSSFVKFLKEMR